MVHELLSDLQLAVLRAVWARGKATVAEVHAVLEAERGLALTTVATVMNRLDKRGLLAHERAGRQFVYRALVSEEDVRQSAAGTVAERVFQGDVPDFVSHLLNARDITPEALARVKALIEAKERDLDQAAEEPDAP